jgi:hypothetical protein
MTQANYNRQQVFSECGAGAIFFAFTERGVNASWHLQHRPSLRASVPGTAFCCRPVRSADGWFIPARTLLDAQLFHSPPKVAHLKRQTGHQTSRQMGQVAGEKFVRGIRDRVAGAAELRVLMVAGSRTRHRLKTFGSVAKNVANEGKRMKTSAFVGISKQTCQTTSLATSRWPQERRAGRKVGATAAGGGGGGVQGGPNANIPMGRNERGILGKGGSV